MIKTSLSRLFNGDCLEVMELLVNKGVKVDAIITDPPYEATTCSWDKLIPVDRMWELACALVKDKGAVCLFGCEPFSSSLRMSNLKMYKYDWVWKKSTCSNFIAANYQPRKIHELVSVFSKSSASFSKNGNSMNYYPQMGDETKIIKGEYLDSEVRKAYAAKNIKGYKLKHANVGRKFPESVVYFPADKEKYHPTAKPVALMEFLVKTYTNEGELVLDFTMGSGTTGVACVKNNRKFLGIEKDIKYFEISVDRIKEAENARQ